MLQLVHIFVHSGQSLAAQRVALGWGKQQVDLRLVIFTVFTSPDVALKCLPGEIMPHCSAEHLQSSKTTNWKDNCAKAFNLSPLSDGSGMLRPSERHTKEPSRVVLSLLLHSRKCVVGSAVTLSLPSYRNIACRHPRKTALGWKALFRGTWPEAF